MNPRGRIQLTSQRIRIGSCEATGLKPRLIVYVKTGSRRFRDLFFQACRHLGLHATELQTWDWITAFDVCGTVESLEELTERKCVESWHYALDCRVPYMGSGAGTEKPKPPHPLEWRLDYIRKQDEEMDKVHIHSNN